MRLKKNIENIGKIGKKKKELPSFILVKKT